MVLTPLVAATYLLSTPIYGTTVAQCKSDSQQLQNKAKEIGDATVAQENLETQAVGQAVQGDNSINPLSNTLKDTALNINKRYVDASSEIGKLGAQCFKVCDPSSAVDEEKPPGNADEAARILAERKKCEDFIAPIYSQMIDGAVGSGNAAQQAAETAAASNNNSGGGGMSPMMAGLLGAALGAGAAMLLNKKKDEKGESSEVASDEETKVVDTNGTIDCEASGSEAYSDCNDHYVAKCLTDLSSESCKAFSSRYCSTSGSSSGESTTQSVSQSSSGVIIASAEDKNKIGEGFGSAYCMKAQATDFCSTSGREDCPSCQQLEASKAEVCGSNPALCLMQNDPNAIETAKRTCPSDPMFSYANYTSGGGSTVPNSEGLKDPILPGQSISAPGSSGSESDTAVGATLASASSGGFHSGSSFGIISDVAGSEDERSAASNSRSKRSISRSYIGSSVGSYKSSNSNRTPTSYGSAMGPSLFSVSSAIIQGKCNKGELAHCRR